MSSNLSSDYSTGTPKIILGIDPGLRISGYSVFQYHAHKTVLVDCGYLQLPEDEKIPVRIELFYTFFLKKISQIQATDLALETPFLGKNSQNFLKLGYLRGILYLLAQMHHLNLHEFSPTQVKQAVTGFGGASKEQVARILLQLFPSLPRPKKFDVTDAMAVGLCGLWKNNRLIG